MKGTVLLPVVKLPHSGLDSLGQSYRAKVMRLVGFQESVCVCVCTCTRYVGAAFRMRRLWAASGHVCNLSLAVRDTDSLLKKEYNQNPLQ